MLHKEKFENFIVYKTIGMLKEYSVKEELATLLYNLQYNESTILPQLKSQFREKECEIDNIVTAIQQGIASQALMKRLNEIEKQKADIETAITKEQIKALTYSVAEDRMALCNFGASFVSLAPIFYKNWSALTPMLLLYAKSHARLI